MIESELEVKEAAPLKAKASEELKVPDPATKVAEQILASNALPVVGGNE